MLYFLDTEFNERPGLLELISLGMVSEDGRELYAELPWNPNNSNDWVRQHVWPHLVNKPARVAPPFGVPGAQCAWTLHLPNARPDVVVAQILDFVGDDATPRFWTYYGAYDWVAFCWLFGRMVDLPEHFPKYARDLKQSLDAAGLKVPDHLQAQNEHNALADAHFNRRVYEWLKDVRPAVLEP